MFITAVPITSKLFAWGGGGVGGGHVLRETTSRGLCGLVCPSRTIASDQDRSKCNGIVYFCRKFMQNYTYKFPNMAKMHFGRLLLPSCRELWLANCRTFCKGSSLAPAVRAACVHRVFVPITHTTTLHGHGERCASRAQRAPSRARPWDVRTWHGTSLLRTIELLSESLHLCVFRSVHR